MAATGLVPGTQLQNTLKSMWDSEMKTAANEEGVIHPDIPKGSVEKIGDAYYVRVTPAFTVRTASSTDNLGPEQLTYESANWSRVTGTIARRYLAVEVPISSSRALTGPDWAAAKSAIRKQATGALDQAQDENAGALASNLSVVAGTFNADKSNLLNMAGLLRTNAKEHVKNGTVIRVKYHPSQVKYVNAIAEIANANLRGSDGQMPNVTGVVLDAWGMSFAETGNITFSAGNYLNFAFAPSAFAKAYNVEPMIKEVGMDSLGLVDRVFGYGEWVFVEVFDADAIVWKSV